MLRYLPVLVLLLFSACETDAGDTTAIAGSQSSCRHAAYTDEASLLGTPFTSKVAAVEPWLSTQRKLLSLTPDKVDELRKIIRQQHQSPFKLFPIFVNGDERTAVPLPTPVLKEREVALLLEWFSGGRSTVYPALNDAQQPFVLLDAKQATQIIETGKRNLQLAREQAAREIVPPPYELEFFFGEDKRLLAALIEAFTLEEKREFTIFTVSDPSDSDILTWLSPLGAPHPLRGSYVIGGEAYRTPNPPRRGVSFAAHSHRLTLSPEGGLTVTTPSIMLVARGDRLSIDFTAQSDIAAACALALQKETVIAPGYTLDHGISETTYPWGRPWLVRFWGGMVEITLPTLAECQRQQT